MPTTIQVNERTLELLRKVKGETNSSSYDETINKIVRERLQNESMAGYLGKMQKKDILKGLRDKNERF